AEARRQVHAQAHLVLGHQLLTLDLERLLAKVDHADRELLHPGPERVASRLEDARTRAVDVERRLVALRHVEDADHAGSTGREQRRATDLDLRERTEDDVATREQDALERAVDEDEGALALGDEDATEHEVGFLLSVTSRRSMRRRNRRFEKFAGSPFAAKSRP